MMDVVVSGVWLFWLLLWFEFFAGGLLAGYCLLGVAVGVAFCLCGCHVWFAFCCCFVFGAVW